MADQTQHRSAPVNAGRTSARLKLVLLGALAPTALFALPVVGMMAFGPVTDPAPGGATNSAVDCASPRNAWRPACQTARGVVARDPDVTGSVAPDPDQKPKRRSLAGAVVTAQLDPAKAEAPAQAAPAPEAKVASAAQPSSGPSDKRETVWQDPPRPAEPLSPPAVAAQPAAAPPPVAATALAAPERAAPTQQASTPEPVAPAQAPAPAAQVPAAPTQAPAQPAPVAKPAPVKAVAAPPPERVKRAAEAAKPEEVAPKTASETAAPTRRVRAAAKETAKPEAEPEPRVSRREARRAARAARLAAARERARVAEAQEPDEPPRSIRYRARRVAAERARAERPVVAERRIARRPAPERRVARRGPEFGGGLRVTSVQTYVLPDGRRVMMNVMPRPEVVRELAAYHAATFTGRRAAPSWGSGWYGDGE